jgi:hypothetical protein
MLCLAEMFAQHIQMPAAVRVGRDDFLAIN